MGDDMKQYLDVLWSQFRLHVTVSVQQAHTDSLN